MDGVYSEARSLPARAPLAGRSLPGTGDRFFSDPSGLVAVAAVLSSQINAQVVMVANEDIGILIHEQLSGF